MASDLGVVESSDEYLPYFVVSYAHSPTIDDYPGPDRWVSEFFGDLETAVRQASPRSGPIYGFIDQQIPQGSDWKESISLALGTTQAFVPLYSAGYFTRALPRTELACFRRRVELAGVADPERRIIPVLWTRLPGTHDLEDLLGHDAPGYTKNGLWPMLKIKSYHDSYQAVVNLLAREIVALAEESPIDPSEVPDIDEMKSAIAPGSRLAVFAIEIAVPAVRTAATTRDSLVSGPGDAEWCPFPEQEYTLTKYAGKVVERFDFEAEVSMIKTVAEPRTRRPGIMLIDPWFIANEVGRSALISAVTKLPSWVLPLLILDQPDDPRTRDLTGQVREILSEAGALPTDSSRLAAQGITSLSEFLSIVPTLVIEAERQYLRYRSGRVRSQPSVRPSLRGPRPAKPAVIPDRPATPDRPAQDSLGESSDA